MIIRAARPLQTFSIVDNRLIRDRRLSFRARGLLVWILSLPDNAQIDSNKIARQTKEGRDAIRTALAELESAGYLSRRREQDSAGLWKTVSLISEIPVDNPEENTPPPEPEKPTSDNQALREILISNTEIKDSDGLHKGEPEVCGQCDGTGWTADDHHNVTRCPCPGGVWPHGNP